MNCHELNDLLLDYAEGQTLAAQNRAVELHLQNCFSCRHKLEDIRCLLDDFSVARSLDNQTLRPEGLSAALSARPGHRGRTMIGDFEIVGEMGRGGMGVVYRARQRSLNRIVALKVLSSGLIQSDRSIQRFHREAQAAARLHHTNIVPIYAQGEDQGCYYYAMELIEGASLKDHLTQRSFEHEGITSTQSGTREFKRLARMVAEVADALEHAHQQSIVHRDIKPQNLLLGPDDKLHITDFGLARLLDEPGMTLTTETIGSPAYMAPEQLAGGTKEITPRTDVYALGVTLYEWLTGRRPFDGSTYEQVIYQIVHQEPCGLRKINPRIPDDLETICLRAMEKDPQRRFPSAQEMARDLMRYAEDFPISSRKISVIGKALRWSRRYPARSAAILASAFALILLPILVHYVRVHANEQIQSAYDILLQDYHDGSRALDELGWASRWAGRLDQQKTVQAFAIISESPDQSAQLLEDVLRDQPNRSEVCYLLAWAYKRLRDKHGEQMWVKAQQMITQGDQLLAGGSVPSAEGYFFRGLALMGVDAREAEKSFDQAVSLKLNFTQAMLQQARAANQIMYNQRDVSYYQKARSRLEFICDAQPTKAYPRYLLSIAHRLAAEIYEDSGQPDLADNYYQLALNAAQDAQRVQPDSPRGYGAEAYYHEERHDYQAALKVWLTITSTSGIQTSEFDLQEAALSSMRLHYWLGEYEQALESCRKRYATLAGQEVMATFYNSIILSAMDQSSQAKNQLDQLASGNSLSPEERLLLASGYDLLGVAVPDQLLSGTMDFSVRLPPGWTQPWIKILVAYYRKQVSWEDLITEAKHLSSGNPERLSFLLAGAYFYKGAKLFRKQPQEALNALHQATTQYDNENYCFKAKMILYRTQNRLKK